MTDDGSAAGVGCEVVVTLRGELARFDDQLLSTLMNRLRRPGLTVESTGAELVDVTFVHESRDLWVSLLETVHAAWATGYEPVRLSARLVAGERAGQEAY